MALEKTGGGLLGEENEQALLLFCTVVSNVGGDEIQKLVRLSHGSRSSPEWFRDQGWVRGQTSP